MAITFVIFQTQRFQNALAGAAFKRLQQLVGRSK